MNNTDKLEFKLINAKEANEAWAEDYEKTFYVVEIYLNGKELVPILKEIEQPFCDKEGTPEIAGGYGHNLPEELYNDLTEAAKEGAFSEDHEAALLCCDGCGFSGCWSVMVSVRQTEKYVYWENFRQNHRADWQYNLSYRFDREEYNTAMAQMKSYIKC